MEQQSNNGYEKLPDIYEQFKKVFKQLPLDGCTLKSNRHQYLEKESDQYEPGFLQFVAPPGKIFKLTDDFEVETDSNDELFYYRNTLPMPSISLLQKRIDEDPQLYNDDDYPFGSDFFYREESFYGKRLTVSIDGYRFGSPWRPNIKNFNNVKIEIEGLTDASAETGYKTIFLEDKSGSDFYRPYRYTDPLAYIVWKYDVAYTSLENIQIFQVDDDLPRLGIKPIYADSRLHNKDQIWMPYNITTDSIREYYKSHEVDLTDDQILQEIRHRRQNSNLGIADDPLRDWWLPSDNANLNLQELVNEIESSKGLEVAKNIYFGQDDSVEKELDMQPNYINKRHIGKIAIVSGDVPLWQIVHEERQRNLNKTVNNQ